MQVVIMKPLQWQQVCVCVCVCLHTHTHLLNIELSNFTNKFEMNAFIPRNLYSGGDDHISSW
jgi:hypothetical protein